MNANAQCGESVCGDQDVYDETFNHHRHAVAEGGENDRYDASRGG
jgi:hypothetical protein